MEYDINGKLMKTRSTFQEFLDVSAECAEISEQSGAGDNGSLEVCSEPDSFYGDALTYEEMLGFCYSGYNARAIQDMGDRVDEHLTTIQDDDELSVDGESLDVGTFLSGSDKCFWRESDERPKRAQIHIVFSSNATAGHGSDAFLVHGGTLVALANALDAQYDVKVSGYFTNTGVFTGKGCQVFEIKDYPEAMDCARLGAVTHPSWFRRIGFAMFESLGKFLGESECRTGYGRSITDRDRAQVVDDHEFAEWCRIDEDEIVVDFPAPSRHQFAHGPAKAAEWLEREIDKIKSKVEAGEQHIKMFDE